MKYMQYLSIFVLPSKTLTQKYLFTACMVQKACWTNLEIRRDGLLNRQSIQQAKV